MQKKFLKAVSLLALLVTSVSSFAQSSSPSVLNGPSRDQLQSTVGGMGLSMDEKLTVRSILQNMQQQGAKVRADKTLSDDQKVAQIVKIRHAALSRTLTILNPAQQKKLADLLLPKQ